MAVYKERTYLVPWIRWGAVVLISAIMIFSILAQTTWNSGEDDELIATIVSMIGGLIGIAIALILRFDLRMTRDVVEYQMFPLEWKTRRIKVDEIASMEVKKFSTFPRYGGFGRRRKPWKKEVAYIMNRKSGLYVYLKDGKTRIFSTDSAAKLKQFLRSNHPGLFKSEQHEEI